MSQSAWQKLFAALEHAEVTYANLQCALTAFFSSRGVGADSEFLAGMTFDRIVQKIDEGVEVRNVKAYAKTVAGLIFKEYCKGPREI